MPIQIPGNNEALPPRPSSSKSGDGAERPPYPPAGYADTRAALASAEAAARAAENPEAELAALENGTETPAARQQRLEAFVKTNFAGLVPAEFLSVAVERSIKFEDQYRALFEEPTLTLSEEDVSDPELQTELKNVVSVAANNQVITERTVARDERLTAETNLDENIVRVSAEISSQETIRNEEQAAIIQRERVKSREISGRVRDQAKNFEVDRDLSTVKELQANFERIKAENGGSTLAALKTLLGEKGIRSPEMRAIVGNAIATAEALVTAIPGKEGAIARLLDQTGLSLGAVDQAQTFASFLAAAEASDDFTDEEVTKLRSTVAGSDETIRTGTDFENALPATVLDEDGNEVPAYPEDDPLEFGLGVQGYTSDNGETGVMKATPENGHPITVDVTHLSANGKAIMGGYLGLWKAAEDAGETDYFLDVVQFDIRGQSVVDEIKLIEAAQTLNAVFGGRTGYNGEIVSGNDQTGLIQWQAQLRSPKGDAGRSDYNKSDTRSNLQGLRVMDANGNIDLAVLRAFDDYSRDNWFSAPKYEDVQAYLIKLFPEKFARDTPSRMA